MEQIYYTQCPVGYGLGASNGFQVKRLSPGYPVTGDFRHLGLRAFLPGARTPAPAALRYRRGGDGVAEVALLTPRTHEYETERGLWGRPGGHFAHGLRLDGPELAALRHWPAGLSGSPFWKRADPVPSLGRPPDPVAPAPGREPGYATAAALAAGRGVAPLAALLTALADAVRTGRTLFLVDRPDRLADLVALLTLALPEAFRAAVTFSTYHDRPDDLPGFRLHGTGPDPRLNRQAMRAQGVVADLAAPALDPPVAAARWALTLAGWLVDPSDGARAAWEATDRRASAVPPASVASDDGLDRLYDLPARLRTPAPVPTSPHEWAALADLADWARDAGLGAELSRARGPDWWCDAVADGDEARRALVAHTRLAGDWGGAVAGWLARCPADRRRALLDAACDAAPADARPAFLRALMAASPPEIAGEILRRLKSRPGVDADVLRPLEVRGAADRVEGGASWREFRDLIGRATAAPAVLTGVLDALAAEAGARPRVGPAAVRAVTDALLSADDPTLRALIRWSVGRGDGAVEWLTPYLRALAAAPDAVERWDAVRARTDPAGLAALARAALAAALGRGVPDGLFRWGVEALLLPLAEADRPHDPAWPEAYLDRTPSGLELTRRLFAREYRGLGVGRWLAAARGRGELSAEASGRLDAFARYARALKSGDARAVAAAGLPEVAPGERGALLAQVLSHTDGAGAVGTLLDACRAAWPGGFDPGAEGLPGVAAALAPRLPDRHDADLWLARLSAVLDRLGLRRSADGAGFEPDGLAAGLVAATARLGGGGFSPWRFRAALLRDDAAWRALGADAHADLAGRSPAGWLAALDAWDRNLAKGVHSARFFEVWLNACDGPALAAAVAARAGDLRTLPALPWWRHRDHPGGADDLRDAFARLAPMAPLDEEALGAVRAWVRRGDRSGPPPASALSDAGRSRWRCLEALSAYHRPGLGAEACWQVVEGWYAGLPLAEVAEDDRYRFVAWLVPRLEGGDGVNVARLATWLVRCGLTDADRLGGWADDLAPWADVPAAVRAARAPVVAGLRAEWKTVVREAREGARKTREPGSPSPP